jgi:hypothetical protein
MQVKLAATMKPCQERSETTASRGGPAENCLHADEATITEGQRYNLAGAARIELLRTSFIISPP